MIPTVIRISAAIFTILTTTTKLQAAVDEALRADNAPAVASSATAYQQAMEKLSACISANVGERLLPETAVVAVDARKQLTNMQANRDKIIEKAKQELRDAISVAQRTRKLPPLGACLDKWKADELLHQSCKEVFAEAENLLKQLLEEEAERTTAVSVGACPLLRLHNIPMGRLIMLVW